MNMLSPHLSEAEFLATSHREFLEDQEQGWPSVRDMAQRFAVQVFEPVRAILGPLHVNSGFRCGKVNAAVGGVPTSRHVLGLAADVVPLDMPLHEAMDRIADAAAAGALPDLDKALFELQAWIHLQGAPPGQAPKRELLSTRDGRIFTPWRRMA